MMLNATEQGLLNNYQQGFPLIPEPFHVVAQQLNTRPATVLTALKRFHRSGVISRIGPVFRPNTIGSSTLAAISVPERKLVSVANHINAYPEVNHNYEREHEFNLWFVVNTDTRQRRDAVLHEIERETGYNVMSLPLVRDYHIDLGFELDFTDTVSDTPARRVGEYTASGCTPPTQETRDLISALQEGLAFVERPYANVAANTGLCEQTVLKSIDDMLRTGAMKRFGVVVRHHELGYRANAMCVWDVPDNKVDAVGEMLAQKPYVTLCYRRPRNLPHWPYNLFCMIHGKYRTQVVKQIQELVEQFDLDHLPRSVLFSGRRFKQRGAHYRRQTDSQPDNLRAGHG